MKRFRFKLSTVLVFTAVASMLLFSACSGVIGGPIVRITLPDLPSSGGSRYIATGADTPDEVHIVVAQKNNAYSYNNFEGTVTAVSNNVYSISNLLPDTYIFGVALLDSSPTSRMVNFKLKEVTIEPGFNDIVMELGPGISTLELNGLVIDNPFLPEGFTVSYGTDAIIFDVDTSVSNTLGYVPSAGAPVAQKIINGVPVAGALGPIPWTVNPGEDGVFITISALPDGSTQYFSLLLE